MERAGADDLPEDAERQGLGTPATRASILEKLVQMGFVERRGKQLLPTKDGHNLACVLPEVLTSPQLTAQWETELTAIAKGQADPEGFMAGIAEMTRGLIANYSQISEDAQKLFQAERVVIGKCPRCGESVYEGKKNYYCGNRSCQFVMWKNDRFFEERGKCALPGFVDSKNEEKTERNAGYLVVSHSGGGMLRQGTRKGIRRTPANRGMRAHRIVKGLDISEDVCHGMCP